MDDIISENRSYNDFTELFKYEMTQVLSMLQGEFASFSGKNPQRLNQQVSESKISIPDVSFEAPDVSPVRFALPLGRFSPRKLSLSGAEKPFLLTKSSVSVPAPIDLSQMTDAEMRIESPSEEKNCSPRNTPQFQYTAPNIDLATAATIEIRPDCRVSFIAPAFKVSVPVIQSKSLVLSEAKIPQTDVKLPKFQIPKPCSVIKYPTQSFVDFEPKELQMLIPKHSRGKSVFNPHVVSERISVKLPGIRTATAYYSAIIKKKKIEIAVPQTKSHCVGMVSNSDRGLLSQAARNAYAFSNELSAKFDSLISSIPAVIA